MTKPLQTGPIDLNILPEAYRPKAAKPIMVLLASVAGGLFFLAIICFVLLQVNRAQVGELRTSADRAQEKLRTMRTPAPEIAALAGQLASDQHALEVLQTVAPTVAAGQRDWEAIFGAILSYDATSVRLLELLQDGNDLRLGGLALSQDKVLAYAGVLDRSGVFEQVIVQSMESSSESFQPVGIMPTDTPTGTVGAATPLPPGETPLPTGSPYDPYEIDDFAPQNIFVGEVQRHNFSPIYDADLVQFLGKAGRRYCVQALPQAAGVDTVLEVTVSGVTLTNDDCHPNEAALMLCRCPTDTITGSLASLVEVQVPSTGDQQVQVKVTNRGQYGPDQWYALLVTEASGDLWESDDRLPKPIALGEVQRRTFYPEGDIDRVVFPVKAGYAYELSTSGLAVGVDTVVTVDVAGSTFQSDDVSAGNLASAVRFQAIVDGQASAVITNKGQYGTGMTYALELHQVGGDAYEPDDYTPRPLSPFEQQAHTFFPIGDIDRAEFNVKAGRIYEVRTYSLTVGVDTVLSVLVDGLRYQNDDVTPGDPTSRLVFQAQRDGVAGLTITNREQYGAYHSYYLALTELAGMPTPNYALTPTPLPGATATPTATFTPDCRDDYEPDDAVGRQIAVGDTQQHNFCPLGDSDRLVFTAKAGYAYRVETTGLALGVDTYLSVQIGGSTLTNDDRLPQDLSSSLQVQNLTGYDTPVFVRVTNKGPLYGEGKTYTIAVSDLGAGDAYEVDDVMGVAIAVGSQQARSFYPVGDVDRAIFTAKAGYAYRVATSDLALGVDTRLIVRMGINEWTNDDVVPQDLSSLIEVRNDTASGQQVTIKVENRGAFGVDKTYQLGVSDLSSGAEVGDSFEPDDAEPAMIAFGVPQRHSFAPKNDIDKVTFGTEARHLYRISTYDLAAGVDTLLTAEVAIVTGDTRRTQFLANDNVAEGTLASAIQFWYSGTDPGTVVVTVTQNGNYGVDKTYMLLVEDLGAGDAFESDDVDGVPIAVGGSQQRTFYPEGDVDRAYFVAKAGHLYEVSTSNLTGLADTFITVEMGAARLINDDRYPGDLSSRVELLNATAVDTRAMVTVSNLGAYRTDGTYQLWVKDLGTEAGDVYEPDLTIRRLISVNEVQRHTFHPDLDLDRVFLQVKAGRRYVVYTCGEKLIGETITDTTYLDCDVLPPGTDTVLTVAGPIRDCEPGSCQNDDISPGTGYLNSRVSFWSQVDGEVTITIYSKGLFGPTRVYYLGVEELDAVAPTPVVATPTMFISRTPTVTRTLVRPPTITATPRPYVPPLSPTVAATRTPTPAPYPPSTDSGGGARNVLAGDGRGVRVMLAAPMISKSLLQPELQQAGNSTIQFVLSLRMRRVTP